MKVFHAILSMWIVGSCACLFAWQAGSIYASPDYRLQLGGHHFDPVSEGNGQEGFWQGRVSEETDLQLVQFHGPVHPKDLDHLKTMGLEPISYIYPFTYIVWGKGTHLGQTKQVGTIRWSGPFAPGFRLLPAFRGDRESIVQFRALIYRGAKKATVLNALNHAGAEELTWFAVNQRFAGVSFSSPQKNLSQMAGIPGVVSLQPARRDGGLRGEMSAQHLAGQRDVGGTIQPGYASWLQGLGLSGQGVVMAIVDGGVDGGHPDFSMREQPCSGDACAGGTADNHGTHVAGGALGDGSTNTLDSGGFLRGLGLAPEADFVDFLESAHTQPGGMLSLMTQAVRNGATLSNNSWGASSQALGQ